MSPPRKVPKHRELKENPKETDHPQKTTPRYIKNDTFWELIRLSFAGTSGGGERSDFRPVWCIPQGISPARVGNPRGFWGIRGSARKADGSGIPGGRGVETSARAGNLNARLIIHAKSSVTMARAFGPVSLMVQIPEPPA